MRNIFKTNLSNKGFTLVELLLVVTLIAISVGLTNDVLISLVRSYSKTQVKSEIEQQANFAALKMQKELRGAQNVQLNTSSRLYFCPADSSCTGWLSLYQVDSNVLYTGTISTRYPLTYRSTTGLNGVNVTCGASGCFRILNSNPTVIGIDMIFSSASTTNAYKGTVHIRDTIVVRNSY